jgi:Mn2+/Fe2+ NRAMP family transporter
MTNSVERFWNSLGPGMMMGATAIGLSHLVLAPIAGARYGYALVWVIVVAHILKYPCFEAGPRYSIATGESLISGYSRVPGPKNWGLWMFFVISLIGGCTATSALLSISAAVLFTVTGGAISLPVLMILLAATVVALLAAGGYGVLAKVSTLAVALLTVVAIFAFSTSLPPAGAVGEMFTVSIPDGSFVLTSSLVGLMPTAVIMSVWHSIWAIEHTPRWSKLSDGSRPSMMRLAMRDLRLGYLMSAITAILFLSLGATILLPRGLTPQGLDVFLTISRIYTESIGSWTYPVFMIAAFVAVFSSTYAVLDAFPRSTARMLAVLLPNVTFLREKERSVYWIYLVLILFYAILVATVMPNPVIMVLISGVTTLVVGPLVYGLNYYCVTRLIDDDSMRPNNRERVWAAIGIIFMIVVVGLTVYAEYG